MTTNVYAAKRAVFDRFATLAVPGGRLDGTVVAYSWPGDQRAGRSCVYGGAVRFTQADDSVDGTDVLAQEAAVLTVYMRVVRDVGDDDVRHADVDAETTGGILGAELARDRKLAGGMSYASLSSGEGHYSLTDEQVISLLVYSITVTSYIQP